MNKPSVTIASDYAYLSARNASFYFGYEHTDDNGDWCFVAKVDGKEIVIPYSKLSMDTKSADMYDCASCLMMGIGWILARYRIQL